MDTLKLNINLSIRPERPEDEPFLRELRADFDTERLLLDHSSLEDEERAHLLESQFQAREKSLKEANWDKTHCIIEIDEHPIGTFVTMQDSEEIRLADICIDKLHRGMGIGAAIIQCVQGEGQQSKRVVRLHVERDNPAALAFYEKMGFRFLEDRVTHLFLEWTPPELANKTLYFPGQ